MSLPIEKLVVNTLVDILTPGKKAAKHKNLHDPTRVITEREKHAMWIAHMEQVLALDPANAGMTIIMSRNNKSHRFVIPIAPIPKPNHSTPL